MAIDALDFDGGPHFAIEFAVAVGILHEMAIDAVHAFFEMNVHQVHRRAVAIGRVRLLGALPALLFDVLRHLHRRHQMFGRDVWYKRTLMIEEIALAILLVDRSINPAVAMEVGELRVLQMRIELGDILQKLGVGP